MTRAAFQAACSAPNNERTGTAPRANTRAQTPRAQTLGNWSMAYRRTSKIALLFAVASAAAALTVVPAPALASDAQKMCMGDAMRLCGHEVPNVQRITACMVRNRSQVSPGCRAVMDREHTARRRATAAAADD